MERKLEIIKGKLAKELSCSAHNIDHSVRVLNLCMQILSNMKTKEADKEVLEIAALMHDIAQAKESDDPSGNTDHAVEGAKMAEKILQDLDLSPERIRHIQDCIITHRYRTKIKPKTLEAQILFDADKIEGMGAIGIARMYAWVGRNGANIYKKTDLGEYAKENLTNGDLDGRCKDKTKHSPQIEFEIKTMRLKDKLHTKEARDIFDERVLFMEKFFNRLEKEIEGKV